MPGIKRTLSSFDGTRTRKHFRSACNFQATNPIASKSRRHSLFNEENGKIAADRFAFIFRRYIMQCVSLNLFPNIKLYIVEAFLRSTHLCLVDEEIYETIRTFLPRIAKFSGVDIRAATEQILAEGSVANYGQYEVCTGNRKDKKVIKLWNLNPDSVAECLQIAISRTQLTESCYSHINRTNSNVSISNLLNSHIMDDFKAHTIYHQLELVGKVFSLTFAMRRETDFVRKLKLSPPEKWTCDFINKIFDCLCNFPQTKST